MRYFVLQGMDDALDMPLFETRLFVSDVERLREILGSCASDDVDLAHTYTLDEADIASINHAFGVAYVSHGRETTLAPWRSVRLAPYLVHTGFELPLMLEGRKPMAVFNDAYLAHWLDHTEQRFAPHVANGHIKKRVQARPQRKVYFCLPGQEWRVEEHIKLCNILSNGTWNDSLERKEGSLLGYSNEQNDWWIAFRQKLAMKKNES